ncbi:hypothetical protein ABW20_dc0105390 [Dactylellina cionopaga]|nr:hypothetical protein ABW20_dc0105390 [Dactylellina cionopaga]
MALPPHTIRIKRRRNEDPLTNRLLFSSNPAPNEKVVESKRRRVDGEFCFILHDTVESAAVSNAASPAPLTAAGRPNGSKPGQQQQPGIPIISTSGATPTREDAPKDAFQPGSFNEALSDREGRPIVADRQLAITKREIKKAVSPARSVRLKKKPTPMAARHKLSESISNSTTLDPAALSPTTKAEVRRYHLSKKMKIENGGGGFEPISGKKRERGLVPVFIEGAGRVAKKRSAVKIGADQDSDSQEGDEDDNENGMQGSTRANTTKKPQTHFKEKAMLRRNAEEVKPSTAKPNEGLEFGFDSDELAQQLQDMVLDYISNQPDLDNYSAAATKSPIQEKRSKALEALGGGVGGGTWAGVEKAMELDSPAGDAMKLDSDGEDSEWVYDVYFRQELKKSQDGNTAITNGDYGVLVISNSDDEQWWYENDEDEESASDVWGSEDEDSNAEEYYRNDYPDEDDYDLVGSDNDSDGNKQYARPRVRGQKKGAAWDHDSDRSYDLELDDDSD